MVKGASAVLSKARRARGFPSAAIKPTSRDTNMPVGAVGAAARASRALSVAPRARGARRRGAGRALSPASRRALKNGGVRSRLFLLVITPPVTAVAAGGVFIASSVQSALVYQRV